MDIQLQQPRLMKQNTLRVLTLNGVQNYVQPKGCWKNEQNV